MKRLSKKIISLMLAVIMIATMIPAFSVFADEPQISTQWSLINSTDLTTTSWSKTGNSGSYNYTGSSTFKGVNNNTSTYCEWSGIEYYTDKWNSFDNVATYGTRVRDGFMYLNGWYKDGTKYTSNTPITGKDAFKIDIEFSFFGDYTLAGSGSDDYWKNTFLKLKTDSYSGESNIWENQWFSQAGYGSMYKKGDSAKASATVLRNVGDDAFTNDYFEISTDNPKISKTTLYHYVMTYSHNTIRAYITTDNADEEGDIIINLGSIEWAGNTNEIKGIMIGATSGSNSNVYYQNIAFRQIKFYEGTEANYSPEKEIENDKYIYAYFTGNSDNGENLRYAVSEDGYNWKSLNGADYVANVQSEVKSGSTVLDVYPTGGRTGLAATGNVRDPYFLYAQDGTYYVLATDLDTDTYGFNNNCKLLVWHINTPADIDNVTPWCIDCTSLLEDVMGSSCVLDRAWAPEAIYDREKGKYMLFFAASDTADTYGTRMYYVYTEDFKTFDGKAKILLPHVKGNNIDANITYADGLYYMWYKDETNSKIGVATAEHANGPYGVVKSFYDDRISSVYEGCEVFYRPQSDKYVLIADNFGGGSYMGAYENASVGAFTASDKLTDGTQFNMTHLYPRHGNIARITTEQYNALIKKYGVDVWGTSNLETGKNANDYLIARYFTADDATLDASGHKNHLDSANVTMGDYHGKFAADFDSSKSASLACASMLSNEGVNAKDGITFDWYGYSTADAHGRFFDMASVEMGTCVWDGSGNNQKNSNYIYASEGIEFGAFYGNGSGRTGISRNYTDTENEWHRYTMVLSKGWIEFYVDGTLFGWTVGFNNGSGAIIGANTPINCGNGFSDTVLSSMVNLSFGDSAWRDDEDFGGAISDFRIYKRALSIDDITNSDDLLNQAVYTAEKAPSNADVKFYDPMENIAAADSYDGIAKHSYTASVADDTCANVLNIAGGLTTHNGSTENSNSVDLTSTDPSNGYTISFLYNPLSLEGGNQVIFNIGVDDVPWGTRKVFELNENGYLRFIWDVNSAGDDYIDFNGLFGSGLEANTWHHIALQIIPAKEYDEIYCYIDGKIVKHFSYAAAADAHKISRKSISDYLATEARGVHYGNNSGYSSDAESGRLDEFRIFSGIVNVKDIIKQDTQHVSGSLTEDIDDELEAAMWAYETKMANGTVYDNIVDAYQAYVEANEVLDAIEYGDVNDFVAYKSMKTAKENLVNKTAALTVYNSDFETVTPSFTEAEVPSGGHDMAYFKGTYYDSLIYSPQVSGTSNYRLKIDSTNTQAHIFYPDNTVIAYKSGKTMALPVYAINQGSGGKNRRVFNLYPTNGTNSNKSSPNNANAYVELAGRWRSDEKNGGWWDLNWLYMINSAERCSGTTYNTSNSVGYTTADLKNTSYRYANAIIIKPSAIQSALDSTSIGGSGYADFQLYWQMLAGSKTGQTYYDDIVGHGQANAHIYVIDYQKLINAINSRYSSVGSNVANYKRGGLLTDMQNLESAMDFNIRGYDFSSTASKVTEVVGVISGHASTLGTSHAVADANYPLLKSSITNSDIKNTYNSGAAALKKTYTVSSVNAFMKAYKDAVDHMSGLIDGNYNQSKAGTINTALTTAYNNLDTLADLSALDKAYEKANGLLLGLDGKVAQYDKESIANLISAVQGGSASAYATSSAIERTDYGQAVQTKANGYATAINNAYANLKIAAKTADTTAYEAAVQTINNLDPDAYDSTSSITTARSNANLLVSSLTQNYTTGDTTSTINVVDDNVSQQDVNDATTGILTALSNSIKKYNIVADSGVTSIGSNNGTYADGKATYGTKMTFRSDDDDTAWYLDITSGSVHKKNAFYGYGDKLEVKTIGAITVTTVRRNGTQKRVRILRNYYNNDVKLEGQPIEFADFVDSGTSYTLPAAPAYAYYDFNGYYIGGVKYNAGATVTISADTDIIARYDASDSSCAITATDINGDSIPTSSVKYNEKVELDGGEGTYGWIEQVGDTYRPFYYGREFTMYAAESTNLVAVNETNFKKYGSVPCVNLRQGGVVTSGTKTTFNAQLVAIDMDAVQEYGILVAAPSTKGGYEAITPTASQIIVENSGQQQGFAIVRAKSTKLVGANQFAISVNNLPAGYKYRGYVIYSDGSSLQTAYSDVM